MWPTNVHIEQQLFHITLHTSDKYCRGLTDSGQDTSSLWKVVLINSSTPISQESISNCISLEPCREVVNQQTKYSGTATWVAREQCKQQKPLCKGLCVTPQQSGQEILWWAACGQVSAVGAQAEDGMEAHWGLSSHRYCGVLEEGRHFCHNNKMRYVICNKITI